jgi:hypothetical protein
MNASDIKIEVADQTLMDSIIERHTPPGERDSHICWFYPGSKSSKSFSELIS